jgi:squalene synthase HpnC
MPLTPAAGREENLRAGGIGTDVSAGEAYAHCARVARRHYENFPVASLILPRRIRGPVAAVYAFAREADDFADEPAHAGGRIALLDDWSRRLEKAAAGHGEGPVFVALADAMDRHGLPAEPFRDLLSAFRQDASKSRYEDWGEVLDYCRRSADPVGRLMLLLSGHRDQTLLPLSDSLCTALQLTNFWQDLAVDARRGRIYLPRADRERHEVTEESLMSGEAPRLPGFRPLMEEMAGRTVDLFERGRGLPDRVGGRLGFQLRLTWLGGRRILEETRRIGFDVYRRRPALKPWTWPALLLRSFLPLPRPGI